MKSDDKIGDSESGRKPSPAIVNKDLTNGTNNDNLPSANTIGPGDDSTDSGIPVSHLMMNGIPSPSVPIPYQRLENANQQQQQQQQQMLLYQQQQQQAYHAQYQMLQQQQQQQQAAHYDMNAPSSNYPPFDYTLIQPQSYEGQSLLNAFNPQPNGTNQQDPQLASLGQTPLMSWLSGAMAAQQQTANQQSPYGPSSNPFIMNGNQDNYLQQLSNFHQSPATLPPLLSQPQYWSALPTAVLYSGPPQPILTQQQTLNNEPHSPQSKSSTNNRPLTPTNTDILSSSQPNQQAQQYMNMARTTQTPGTI